MYFCNLGFTKMFMVIKKSKIIDSEVLSILLFKVLDKFERRVLCIELGSLF